MRGQVAQAGAGGGEVWGRMGDMGAGEGEYALQSGWLQGTHPAQLGIPLRICEPEGVASGCEVRRQQVLVSKQHGGHKRE